MPTRGFGAKKVNIDSYIRKKSDTDSDVAPAAEGVNSQSGEARDEDDNLASGSVIAEDQNEDPVGSRSRYDEDADGEMAHNQHGLDEEEEEEEWGSS